MEVQCFPGRQRNSYIIHGGDGFHYNVREVRGNRVRLQCRHYKARGQGCPGTASVSLVTGILRHLEPHSHAPDMLLSDDFELRRAMVEEARTNVFGKKIRWILNEFKLRARNPHLASRFTQVRMNSSLYAARSSNYPRTPKTLIYLGILLGLPNVRPLCTTVDGDDFIFQGVVGCAGRKTVALVFVSGRMLTFMGTLENIHADGTFKKRPRKPRMSQIFNIVTNFGGVVVAVARVIMMRRTEPAYLEVLNYLKTLAPNFEPRRIHCDFERAMMNAFRRVFPHSRIVGCLWHFAVAFSKYCRDLGLMPLAKEDELVLEFIRCLSGVPLLPQYAMWTGVVEIWHEIRASGLGDLFLPVFQYFEREWKPRFNELSCFNIPERTNNCSESDNSSLNNLIPQHRPNVWHLIGSFKQLEYLAYCDKIAVENMRPVTNRKRVRTLCNDDRVRRASGLLVARQITPGFFLHQASHAITGAVNHGLHMCADDDYSDSD